MFKPFTPAGRRVGDDLMIALQAPANVAGFTELLHNRNESIGHRQDDFAFRPEQSNLLGDDRIDQGERTRTAMQAGRMNEMRRNDRAQFGELHLEHQMQDGFGFDFGHR